MGGFMPTAAERLVADLRLRNYAARTQERYAYYARGISRYCGKAAEDINADEVRQYLLYLLEERRCSSSTCRQAVASLRFLYGTTLGSPDVVQKLPYPRREYRLPVVLSPGEVERLLMACPSLTHRVILMAIYSAGLRLREATALRTRAIDTQRMSIHVEGAKGRKDRLVPLSPMLLASLRQYWRLRPASEWVFPGKNPLTSVSPYTVQTATRQARKRAGLFKPVTPRALRHSFATHLLEAGTDLRVIQALLGHARIEATTVYTHLSGRVLQAVASPLDKLALDFAPRQLALSI
jgi:integrase/recombinase XerD